MNGADIELGRRKFFVYKFPSAADANGNFQITILTGSDFFATSVSCLATVTNGFILQNLSLEKDTATVSATAATDVAQVPINSGFNGTPYFFPLPWRLKSGTILRLLTGLQIGDVAVAGFVE